MGLTDSNIPYLYNAYLYLGKECDGLSLSYGEKKNYETPINRVQSLQAH